MTALLITLFMCVFNSTEVKAESYNNGVYETTIDGKITINYTVEGRFGEYSKTAIDGNGTHWRCDAHSHRSRYEPYRIQSFQTRQQLLPSYPFLLYLY